MPHSEQLQAQMPTKVAANHIADEMIGEIEISDQSSEATPIFVRHMGDVATGLSGHATGAIPVEAVPHECEGGAAVCGHRGYDLTNPDSNEVVYSQPKGDIDEREQ